MGEGSKDEELGRGVEGTLGEGVLGKGRTLRTGQPGTTSPERRREGAGEDEWKRRLGVELIRGGGGSGIGVAELRERVDVAHQSTGRIKGTSSPEQRRNRAGEIVEKTLGARGHLPSGYIVSSLRVLKQFAQ